MTPAKSSIEHTSATTPTRYAEAGGVKFAFRELGTPGGVPVVLLHHFTATIDDWDPRVLDGLAAQRHVIYVDNRGVGGSNGKVPGRVQSMAADIVTFVNALGHRQVDLLGFSLGGMVAQVIALEHPHLVRRLVLTGTGPAGFPGVGQPNRRLVADTLRGLAAVRPQAVAVLHPHSVRKGRCGGLHRAADRTHRGSCPCYPCPGRRRAARRHHSMGPSAAARP